APTPRATVISTSTTETSSRPWSPPVRRATKPATTRPTTTRAGRTDGQPPPPAAILIESRGARDEGRHRSPAGDRAYGQRPAAGARATGRRRTAGGRRRAH